MTLILQYAGHLTLWKKGNKRISQKWLIYMTYNPTHSIQWVSTFAPDILHRLPTQQLYLLKTYLALWSTMFRKSWKPPSHCSSSWVQVCHRHVAPSQPLGVRRGRCWTGGSGDNSPCPGGSRCVSVRGTERCEREPAGAGWSDPWSYCPGSPTTKEHSICSTFISRSIPVY